MITLITTPDTRASSPEQICVIIPVFGEQHLTDAVIKDLVDGGHPCAIYVVDNRGDYRPSGVEYVLQTDSNRHWAGGCNLGLSIAKERGHAAYVLLNNDVRLSKRFLAGISAAWSDTGACLIGPAYDHNWPQQRTVYTGLARQYKPRDVNRLVPFVERNVFLHPSQGARKRWAAGRTNLAAVWMGMRQGLRLESPTERRRGPRHGARLSQPSRPPDCGQGVMV